MYLRPIRDLWRGDFGGRSYVVRIGEWVENEDQAEPGRMMLVLEQTRQLWVNNQRVWSRPFNVSLPWEVAGDVAQAVLGAVHAAKAKSKTRASSNGDSGQRA